MKASVIPILWGIGLFRSSFEPPAGRPRHILPGTTSPKDHAL